MNGNCHFVFGTAVATSLCVTGATDIIYQNVNNIGITDETRVVFNTLLITSCLIGSVFPDIDSPKSNIGQLTKPLSTGIGEISKGMGKTGKNHRGIFHDIGIYILLGIFSFFYFPSLMGFFIGALSHLLLDAFNPMGVPVFCGYKKLRLGKIYSGSKESVAFTWILTIGILVIGFGYTYMSKNNIPIPFLS